ncbi:MAG: TetR/AcrR family transcriptional regulator [Candidatus Corynebacterium faecigallinarum]|uniref:TetR/AcrR family transcriptional regulator n=1 Tax=Candidatus Corynebacterium faecigallinarum TaxID=2838528 RepID=UPI003FB85D9C
MAKPYHRENLRGDIMHIAAQLIAERGPDALSLRDIARRADVSHAAPAHHYGDRRGLFTALSVEGFTLLAETLAESVSAARFDRTALAYVRFAVSHPGHYAVMFRPDLIDSTEDLIAARENAAAQLDAGLDTVPDHRVTVDIGDARRAAWALVHGLSSLWLSGAFGDADLEPAVLAAAHQLFTPSGSEQ